MDHKKIRIFVVAVLLAAVPVATFAAKKTYTFGIVPQQSASKLSKLWTPILLYIGDKAGYKLRFSTSRNIPTFEKRLAKGAYDFAYMNPYHYIVAHDNPGYNAFAKAKDKRLKGIIVTYEGSGIKGLEDLDGHTLAFPSPAAFAASMVPRAYFKKHGIDITTKYVRSHDSVYRNVAKHRYPAGGGVKRTFNNASAKVREKLRVLWTSDGYTPHAFAANDRVPDEVVDKIRKVMLELDQYPKGKALLKKIKLKGIEAARDEEWNDVRDLKL